MHHTLTAPVYVFLILTAALGCLHSDDNHRQSVNSTAVSFYLEGARRLNIKADSKEFSQLFLSRPIITLSGRDTENVQLIVRILTNNLNSKSIF